MDYIKRILLGIVFATITSKIHTALMYKFLLILEKLNLQ